MHFIVINPDHALNDAHTKLSKICARLEAIKLMTGGHRSENPHANLLAELSDELNRVHESLANGISALQLKSDE